MGNGAGILLSRSDLRASGLAMGSPVSVRARPDRIELVSLEAAARRAISPPFAAAIEDFIRRYRPVLARLAEGSGR